MPVHACMQIVARKRTTERAEDYDALMDKVAALLLAGCQKLGLLQPNGSLPQGEQGDRGRIRTSTALPGPMWARFGTCQGCVTQRDKAKAYLGMILRSHRCRVQASL